MCRNAITRIDYIVCPASWRDSAIQTWTDAQVHAGQAYVDHIATLLQVGMYVRIHRRSKPTRSRGFDAQAMLTEEGRSKVRDILQHAPMIPWSATPHAHAAKLVAYLQDALGEAFPRGGRKLYKHYLSEATWALHREVGGLRRQCAKLRQAAQHHFMAAAFQAWRAQDATPLFAMLASGWSREACWAEAVQGHRLGVLARRLKAACKHDRAQHFCELRIKYVPMRPMPRRQCRGLWALSARSHFNRTSYLSSSKQMAPSASPHRRSGTGGENTSCNKRQGC